MLGVDSGFEGTVVRLGGVGAGDNGLADIDPARLVFAEAVEGLVDLARGGRAAMDKGKVGFMDFAALLHFAKKGGVFLASGN